MPPIANLDELVKSRKSDGKVKSSSSPPQPAGQARRRESRVMRVLSVRRNHDGMKRNTEIGLSSKPSIFNLN
jgi:hypothetical protein